MRRVVRLALAESRAAGVTFLFEVPVRLAIVWFMVIAWTALATEARSADSGNVDLLLSQLADANRETADLARQRLVAIGPPAVPGLELKLQDPNNLVRARAAQALREILAVTPNAASNDHGEKYWRDQIWQTETDMTMEQVDKLLPRTSRFRDGGAGAMSGQGLTTSRRLDDYWVVNLYFWAGKLAEKPKLVRRAAMVLVRAPSDFTETWIEWYVNGQRASEEPLVKGKPEGNCRSYYDDGRISHEWHFHNGLTDGKEIAWYHSGQKEHEGSYRAGEMIGTWRHWHDNGQLRVTREYRNGKLHGLQAQWYPNGRKQSEIEFQDGVQTGINRGWDEDGRKFGTP